MKQVISVLLLGLCFALSLPSLSQAEQSNKWFPGFGQSVEEIKKRFKGESGKESDVSEPQPASVSVKESEAASAQASPQTASVDPKQVVKNIQQLLVKRGFDAGVADGIAGKKTRDAICHYQAVHELDVNPRTNVELLNHLKQAALIKDRRRYSGIIQHQCEIAHVNNLNNIEAVEMHGYEGILTADDLMCKEVVSPFDLHSNIGILFDSAVDNVVNIFWGKDVELKLDVLREKAKKANWMPLDMEMFYGESIHNKRMEKDGKILSRDSKRHDVKMLYEKGDAALSKLVSAIGEEFPYQFKLFVVDDRSVNAEAIPGGYLYVNSGVFNTDYTDLVIAHEIGHVLRRHTTKELQARLVDTVDTAEDLKKLLENDSENQEAMLEEVLMLHGAIAQYSKQQELQSDACAVRIAMRAQLPQVNRHINGYISDIEKDKMEISKKASSHPAYPERKTRMISVYKKEKEG